LSADESAAVLPLLLLFYFSAGHLIATIKPEFASWFGVTIGAVVLGIRVACLLAEGLLLYCCGWIFKKMQNWTRLE
jgi:hypothetical protein